MRILLVTALYLPHRGGVESVVQNLAREFQRRGHAVRIVTNRYPRTLPFQEIMDGISVTRLHFLLPAREFLRRYRFDLFLAGLFYRAWTTVLLKKIIREFKPDMINSHYLNEEAEFVGRCLPEKGKGIPWVISMHGGDVDGEPLLTKANLVRFRRAVHQADGLTACSGFLAKQAAELEPDIAGKIQVIHNGVDVDLFSKAQSPIVSAPYILAVGQLVWHKGFDILVDAFALVSEEYPDVNLVIAGGGEFRSILEKHIQEKGLEHRVTLTGKLEPAKVASLMAGCAFVAMPSRRESFGIVALEGMAAGKCVLATPVGGIPEFLPCPPNRLVPLEQSAWATAMNEWLAPALSDQLKAGTNMKAVHKFDWPLVAEHYLQEYERILTHG